VIATRLTEQTQSGGHVSDQHGRSWADRSTQVIPKVVMDLGPLVAG
jgi:hypothetical protein